MTLTAPGHPPADTGPGPAGKMHFCVDGWDPTYGTSLELEDALDTSSAQVLVDVDWQTSSATTALRRRPTRSAAGSP